MDKRDRDSLVEDIETAIKNAEYAALKKSNYDLAIRLLYYAIADITQLREE